MLIVKQVAIVVFLLLVSLAGAAEDAKDGGLDEVLVTVQKRVQVAQRVPVSVSAFSKQQLRELAVADVFDLQTSVPSLQVDNSQSASTTSFIIRGVGTSSQNFGLESSVGLYVDGVYRSRQSSLINELVDIEAVEVMRGPQGTIFGRNTASGAIHVKTIAPNHEGDGFLNVTAGNLGLLSGSLALGGSLVEDKLAYRVTAFSRQRDGYVSDLNLGNDKINDRDRQGGRLQLLYSPSDTFSARLIADYSEINEICCSAVTVRNNTFGFAGQPGSDLLLGVLGANIISEDRVFDDVTALNSLPVSDNEDAGVSLELNWGRANDAQLTSITAFRSFDQFTNFDADFTDAALVTRREASEVSSFSQEIRYAVDTQSYDFLIGAYYFDQEIDSGAQFILGPQFSPFISQNSDVAQLINAASVFGIPVADAAPAGTGSRDFFTQDQKSAAVFGQVDFFLSEAMTFTLGLRYTDEEKDLIGRFEQDNSGPVVDVAAIQAGDPSSITGVAFPGWAYTLGGPLTLISARDNVQANLDDSQLTGTIKLSYNPDRTTLYYVSYGTGYKSGGTNTDRIGPGFNTIFGAETSETFEIGIKKDFPFEALRINLSLHHTTTDDFQSVAFTGTGFNLTNAGEVQTRGGELEVVWYPSDTFSISGALVLNDGEFKSFPGSTCWTASPFLEGRSDPSEVNGVCDHSGDPLAFNPEEFLMLSVNKQFTIADRFAYVHADYFYRSSAFEDTDLDPLKEQSGYGILNFKTGMYFGNGSTEVALWMRNALDEDYLGTHFDAPLQDGKLNSYAQEPRTYGISIRRDF